MDGVFASPRHRVVTFSGRTFEIWAEGGLCWLEDQGDGEAIALTQEEVVTRFTQAGILQSKADKMATDDTFFRAIRDADRPLVDALHAVLIDMKAQGNPCDDYEVERQKERAVLRTQLQAYDRPQQPAHPLLSDPRVYRNRAGVLQLRHGMGARFQQKYFGPG